MNLFNDYNQQGVSMSEVAPAREMPLSAKTQETIQKVEALNSVIEKGHLKFGESNRGLTAALRGLEFSESMCVQADRLEFAANTTPTKGVIEFADNINTPLIGNWTFASLNMLIQEIGSNMDAYTVLSMAFPDKAVPAYQVLLDRIAPVTGILPEYNGEAAPLPMVRPLDTYGLVYTSGLWAAKTSLTSKHITFDRKRGQTGFDERGLGQMLAYNTLNLTTQAVVRKKSLINQAIFNNGFSWGGATISSNIPSENYIALSPMGTLNADGSVTYNNPDPYYNPVIAITNILANPIFYKYQKYIRGIVMNVLDLRAILAHPAIQPTTNAWSMGGVSLTEKTLEIQIGDVTKEIAAWYAPQFNIPFIADDGVWEGQHLDGTADNATQQFFVPRGSMYVLMDYTSVAGQNGAFQLTYNMVDPNIEAPTMGLFTGVFPRNLFNSDVINRLDIVAALAGAPAVYMPEAQFILTGLYS